MKATKVYVLLSALFLLVITACQKEEVPDNNNNPIIGKWELKSTYYSIGGPLIYVDAKENIILKFNSDGTLQHTGSDFIRYKVDSNKVSLFKKDQTEFKYFYSIEGNTLNLWPGGDNLCIEGCGEIYTRIN